MASCQEYYDNGERKNGTFRIRPNIKMPSFEVNCIFTNKFAVTEIDPLISSDEMIFPRNESQRCSTPNCFTQKGFQIGGSKLVPQAFESPQKQFQYSASMDQIEVVIE